MANTAKLGFVPLKVLGGGAIEHKRVRCVSNNTNAVFFGDAVVATSAGDFVTATTTTTAVAAVAQGCSYINATGERVERKYLPAATTYSGSTVDPAAAAYLYITADALITDFQATVATSAATLTNISNNAAMVLTAGSTLTGASKHAIDGSTFATTATLPFRFVEFCFRPDNDNESVNHLGVFRINAGFVEPGLTTTGT